MISEYLEPRSDADSVASLGHFGEQWLEGDFSFHFLDGPYPCSTQTKNCLLLNLTVGVEQTM